MSDWQLKYLLKKKKIINGDNKYYLDGRERKVSRTRKLAVVLPFIALLLFGLLFLGYAGKLTGITGKAVCLEWCYCSGGSAVACSACSGCSWNPTYETCSGSGSCLLWQAGGGGGEEDEDEEEVIVRQRCGNRFCESYLGEDCGNCPSDCKCSAGKYCGIPGIAGVAWVAGTAGTAGIAGVAGVAGIAGTAGSSGYSCLDIPTEPKCGDLYCDANKGEDCSNCTADCGCAAGKYCDSISSNDKWIYSCVSEPSKCGNKVCDYGEDCNSCKKDCVCPSGKYCNGTLINNKWVYLCEGIPSFKCGDGYCNANAGEDCSSCAADCGCAAGKYCYGTLGNNKWDYSCASEPPKCGNLVCDAGEDCNNCERDCDCPLGKYCNGTLINNKWVYSCKDKVKCGDGYCNVNGGENCDSCPGDCGCAAGKYCGFDSRKLSYLCMNVSAKCGNKVCDAEEDCNNCKRDCACPSESYCYDNNTNIYKCYPKPLIPKCGDGFCGGEEDCGNCANDCKCPLGENCGYNNKTDSHGCKSIDKECENDFCDEEEEEKEEKEKGEEFDICWNVTYEEVAEECQENWKCDWGMCINGKTEAYNCEDLNNCRTEKYKPNTKDCISLKSDCTPRLECGEWSECKLDILQEVVNTDEEFRGTKTRSCEDKADCLITSSETRVCKVKKPASVLVSEGDHVRICSENKTVARIIPTLSKHGLDIDLILGGKPGEKLAAKPSIDWTKLRGLVPYLLIIIGFIFMIIIYIVVRRKRKEKLESAKAVRIINHLIAKSENARLKGERQEAEKIYKKARLYYHYLVEGEKIRVIKKLKKLENKIGA